MRSKIIGLALAYACLTACQSAPSAVAARPDSAAAESPGIVAGPGMASDPATDSAVVGGGTPSSCAKVEVAPVGRMLQVEQVWPKTQGFARGYQSLDLDPGSCTADVDTKIVPPNCDKSFPWILDERERVYTRLALAGVRTTATGMIHGSDQEIREQLLIMDPHAHDDLIGRLANVCAKPYRNGYRTKVHSLDSGKTIDAFLLKAENTWIWLEFDENGWTESRYQPILKQALADATA